MAAAKSDVEYEPKRGMDEAEHRGIAPAQTLAAVGQQGPTEEAGHGPLSTGTSVAEAMEMSSQNKDPLCGIRLGGSLPDDSGLEMSAAEVTDTEEPSREQRLTDALPSAHYNANIQGNTPAAPLHVLQLDSIAAGQSHAQVSQTPSHQEEEEGIDELQDELYDDVDSAYDADSVRDDDTETLASFITNYRWENGRRYHAYSDGAYWVRMQSKGAITVLIHPCAQGANDEDANDVQDLAHHLYKLTLDNKLHLAPIKNPHVRH